MLQQNQAGISPRLTSVCADAVYDVTHPFVMLSAGEVFTGFKGNTSHSEVCESIITHRVTQ